MALQGRVAAEQPVVVREQQQFIDADDEQGFSGQREVYRYDADLVTMLRYSVDTNGVGANGPSRDSAISGDGRTIAFLSTATNLGGSASGGSNVYVRFVP